jgi:hypothetical protein
MSTSIYLTLYEEFFLDIVFELRVDNVNRFTWISRVLTNFKN